MKKEKEKASAEVIGIGTITITITITTQVDEQAHTFCKLNPYIQSDLEVGPNVKNAQKSEWC